MPTELEDLKVLQVAEKVVDEIWREIANWDSFAKDSVGKQLVRAADSIGANLAEAYGRFHFGEKLKFLYYARGSLFETKYWLNRSQARDLLDQKNPRPPIKVSLKPNWRYFQSTTSNSLN